ncbi:hypothetical protein EBB05_23365 [Methylobacterium brachiatum]|nr:hypothetical protein EBB05_23365 [Methylobacterium brachiatum]
MDRAQARSGREREAFPGGSGITGRLRQRGAAARIHRAAQAHGRGGQAHGAAFFGAGAAFIRLLGA